MGEAWDKWTSNFARRAGLTADSPQALALRGVGAVAEGQMPALAAPVLQTPIPPVAPPSLGTFTPPGGHSLLQAGVRMGLQTGALGAAFPKAVDAVAPAQAPVAAEAPPPVSPEGATFASEPAAPPMGGGGGMGVQVIPEHRRTQGWQVNEAIPASDKEIIARDAAIQSHQNVLENEADAGRYDAMRKEAFARGQAGAQAFFEEQRALHAEQRQQKRDALLKEMEDERAKAVENADTLLGKGVSKFMGVLGAALGAWSGSIRGTGQNAGLQAMQAYAAEEAASQRAKADKENNYYARMRTIFNDDEAAEAATQASILRLAQARGNAIAATNKSELARANWDRSNQAISTEIANLDQDITRRAHDVVHRTDTNVPTQYIGIGGGLGAKDDDVKAYGKALTDAGIPEAEQELAEVQARLNVHAKDGKPLEGVAGQTAASGFIEANKPDSMLSPQGLANRQMVGRTVAAYSKAMTGAGMSDKEREIYVGIIRGAKTVSELQRSIAAVQNAIGARKRVIQATYNPKAVAELERRLGPGGIPRFADKPIVPTIKPAGEKP